MTSLTADSVLQAKFQPTRFREGYDQDEVDDFLDTVTAILRSYEAGERIDASAAVDLCRNARFQPTKFREGYDQHQVDDFLAELEQGFLAIAGQGPDARVRTAGPAPSDSTAIPVYDIGASGPDHLPGEYPVKRLPMAALVLVIAAAVGVVALMVWMFAM
jgi:DivIVA domain-containing protein